MRPDSEADRPAPAAAPVRSWIPIRSLSSRHRERVRAHLLALPPPDRYLRFGYAAGDEQIGRYVDSLDFERDELLGIFNRRLKLVALAHVAVDSGRSVIDGRAVAEFGVSVLPAYRGQGFGTHLFGRAVLLARNHHVAQLLIHALSENHTMLKIASKAGARIHREGGEAEGLLELPPDTLATHAEALLEQGAAEVDYRLKWHGRQADRVVRAIGELRDEIAGLKDHG